MLFELQLKDDDTDSLQPIPFGDFEDAQRMEEDLENVLAEHLNRTLYQRSPLMPFFQERSYQEEADLYALNESGDVVIFELKRGEAGSEAVQQILRYAQEAGQWSYSDLANRYETYTEGTEDRGGTEDLQRAHLRKFGLDTALRRDQFNRRQELRVVGNAADKDLVDAVEYWSGQGLNISYVPYRIYEIGESHYFEFFAKPNDQRVNPADQKGVLFDTNKTYDEDAIWDMFEKERVAAYGDQSRQAGFLNWGDIVFYYHTGEGIVAAGRVVSETKQDGEEEKYHDVEFLTSTPDSEEELTAMPPARIEEVTGESFFWARVTKTPYLTREQAEELLGVLRTEL